jgi:hypothetical protein
VSAPDGEVAFGESGEASEDGDADGDTAPVRSLRSRLADAAARKKGDKQDPSAGVGP